MLAEFQSRKAHRVHVRDQDLLKYLLGVVLVVVGYMSAWTAVNMDHVREGNQMLDVGTTSDQLKYYICKAFWWDYVIEAGERRWPCSPADTSRNNDVVITSKRRHFDVISSKWRRFDVITTLLLRHVFIGLLTPWRQNKMTVFIEKKTYLALWLSFADDTVKCVFLNESGYILIRISLNRP